MPDPGRERFRNARRVIPSGVTSPVRYHKPYPFFVKRADGCRMWDEDDRGIIDMCCGYGALLLGHRRKEIIGAAASQMRRGTLYCAPTTMETDLASEIARAYPSIDKVRLANTGGEATMTAIRLARGHTKRDKIIKFDGCYHGAHDSVLVGAGSGAAHYGVPASAGVPEDTSRNTMVARYNDQDSVEEIITKNPDSIACVIVEPVIANMGLIPPRPGFLKYLRKVTRQNGILLIFDEVVTGFRMSLGGAQQYYNTSPDITTLAKAMGNGFGIAAVGGKKGIMDKLAPGGPVYQASTFAGNPVSTSAAIASIRLMDRLKDRMYPRLERYGAQLARAIDEIAASHGIPHVTNHVGSMLQVFFTDEDRVQDSAGASRCDTKRFQAMFAEMLRRGVFVAPSQFEVAFISNAHTARDIQDVIDAYGAGLKAASRIRQ